MFQGKWFDVTLDHSLSSPHCSVTSLPSVPTSKEEEQEGELELPQVPDHQPQV